MTKLNEAAPVPRVQCFPVNLHNEMSYLISLCTFTRKKFAKAVRIAVSSVNFNFLSEIAIGRVERCRRFCALRMRVVRPDGRK